MSDYKEISPHASYSQFLIVSVRGLKERKIFFLVNDELKLYTFHIRKTPCSIVVQKSDFEIFTKIRPAVLTVETQFLEIKPTGKLRFFSRRSSIENKARLAGVEPYR
jgi:hypothetical protein